METGDYGTASSYLVAMTSELRRKHLSLWLVQVGGAEKPRRWNGERNCERNDDSPTAWRLCRIPLEGRKWKRQACFPSSPACGERGFKSTEKKDSPFHSPFRTLFHLPGLTLIAHLIERLNLPEPTKGRANLFVTLPVAMTIEEPCSSKL